jgi:hypothetical protein
MGEKEKPAILMPRGLDDERSSVALSIANAGVASDLEVTVSMLEVVKQGAMTLSFWMGSRR